MPGRGLPIVVWAASAGLIMPGIAAAPASAAPASGSPAPIKVACSAGAHTLAPAGSRLYPDTGNGGYTTPPTPGHAVHHATPNRVPPGNKGIPAAQATPGPADVRPPFRRQAK